MSWVSSLGRKLFGGGKETTTTTTALDPASQRYVDAMRMQAQAGVNTVMNGPPGMMQPGVQGYQNLPGYGVTWGQGWNDGTPEGIAQAQAAGNPGTSRPGSFFTGPQTQSVGDQAAAFFNPYQQNVISAVQGQYDRLRQNALNRTRQEATLGGGFGGSRMAVLAGERLGQLDQGQAGTIANLLYGGYNNALAMGIPYAEQQRQLREQQLQEPIFKAQTAQGLYNGGLGPYGQTTTQTRPGEGLLPGLIRTGLGAYNVYQGLKGGPQTSPYQSAPQFTMPQPWQAPAWNPQFQGGFGY